MKTIWKWNDNILMTMSISNEIMKESVAMIYQ